jgi:type VI secretion system secreted protein Hcp
MAVDMLLTLDGVKGESEDKNHPKQTGVLSCSWGMNRSGSAHVGGGPSVGKVMCRTCKSPIAGGTVWHTGKK